MNTFFIQHNDNLDQQLQKFWEIEILPNKTKTTEEILYEGHFEQLTARNDTGCYILTLSRRVGQDRLKESV